MWFIGLALLGLQLVGALLRPKQKIQNAEPSSLSDFPAPTNEETRVVPVPFGTCHIRAPNLLWYGDFAVSAIKEKVEGGLFGGSKKVTVGYQYHLGLQYGLQEAPVGGIRKLREIRFDDKPLPTGSIQVVSGKNTIAFSDQSVPPGTWHSANVAVSTYTSLEALAVAAETAMAAAIPSKSWKVVWGFLIVPGRTDDLLYSVQVSGVATILAAKLRPGHYQAGADMAKEVARALNASEAAVSGGPRGTFSCTYSAFTGRFKITFSPTAGGYQGFWIRGGSATGFDIAKTAHVTLGFASHLDRMFTTEALSDYGVFPNRFTFAMKGAGGQLRLSHSSFTARALFGFRVSGSPVDVSIGAVAADYDRWLTGTNYYVSPDYTRVDVNAAELFGGDRQEGGIVGTFLVYHGKDEQAASDYLTEQWGTQASGYPFLCHCVGLRPYIGTNLYIKTISFVTETEWNSLGLTGGKSWIGTSDMNPAAIIYECITNRVWGRGRSSSKVDIQSFRDAADVLYNEGLGLSMMLESPTECRDFIEEVLRHIDGVLFPDPVTSLLTLKLCREDYTVGSLPLLNKDNSTLDSYTRPSWGELRNSVRVRYIDQASDFMERVVKAQDLAGIQARGGEEVTEDLSFRGFSNATNAQKRAARALKAMAYPSARIKLRVNRSGWKLRPGSVFRWTYSLLGITDLPFRVGRVRRGKLEDSEITVEAVEDIFGVPWTAYTPPGAPEWTDPAELPPPLLAARADEIPYALLDAEENRIMTVGVPGATGITQGYEVWTDADGGDSYALTERCLTSTPSGTLAADVAQGAEEITVNDGFDLASIVSLSAAEHALGRNLAMIDNEIIAFRYIERNPDGTWQLSGLARGAADTSPQAHASGARLYVITGGVGLAKPTEYPVGANISVKLPAFNRRGAIPLPNVDELLVTAAERSKKPYSPTGLTLNGIAYPGNVADDLVIAWLHRNRLADWSYEDSGVTPSPEPGTHYVLSIYGQAGTLLRTVDPVTSPYTYTRATELADSGGILNESLRVAVTTIRDADGVFAAFPIDVTVDAAGWGMLWGEYWGGNAG